MISTSPRYHYSVASRRSPTAFKFARRSDACAFAVKWGKVMGDRSPPQVFRLDSHGRPKHEEKCTGGMFGRYGRDRRVRRQKRRVRRRRK